MCLEAINSKLTNSIRFCYKLVERRGDKMYSTVMEYPLDTDNTVPENLTPLEDRNGVEYPAGFHAYGNLKDALDRSGLNVHIMLVQLSGKITVGHERGKTVIVGEKMSIMKEVANPKEINAYYNIISTPSQDTFIDNYEALNTALLACLPPTAHLLYKAYKEKQ